MTQTVIVLVEETLLPTDVEHILALSGDEAHYHLLVPTGNSRNVVAAFLDYLAIYDFKEAWEELTGQNRLPLAKAKAEAEEVLRTSVITLEAGGGVVDGGSITQDVMGTLKSLVAEREVQQVIAITEPHAVVDTFHTGWSDKAKQRLGLPVLHFYRGTSYIGS